MATVFLSSTAAAQVSAMSSRRIPLSTSNPNVVNSPVRASAAAHHGAKKIRSHADMMREEAYAQPPPAKRQMLDRGVASPTRSRPARTTGHRSASRAAVATTTSTAPKASQATDYKPTDEELANLRTWHAQIRSRFPKMVFYFESIPDEQRSKLAKLIGRLGARDEKFFSIDITHIVTARPIPAEKPKDDRDRRGDGQEDGEQLKTIDPALLNRQADPTKRKLVFDTSRRPKARSADVLDRARDMGKKIWSLEKLQKILEIALQSDPYTSAAPSLDRGGGAQSTSKATNGQSNLAQLLEDERVHGPSDRDPTVASNDMVLFKGPYILVYDLEGKFKPTMIRDYHKAGDWPQFRIAAQGRCPFIPDETENLDRDRAKARAAKARAAKAAAAEVAEAAVQIAAAVEAAPPKQTFGKRTLSQMEDGHNRGAASVSTTESFDRSRISNPPSLDFRSQNAFISKAKAGRLLAGEPVASGLQPSNVTSAIRSQMISSTTGGVLGAKAGTSKEIHGLQRKVVLQKTSTPALSQDLSSRRLAEMSHDSNGFIRSASLSTATHRKLDTVDEEETARQREGGKLQRSVSVPVSKQHQHQQPPKPKRDPKPGYCENCQDKFDDFEDHIVSRKHRKFAENDENWAELDDLLSQLKRVPRF